VLPWKTLASFDLANQKKIDDLPKGNSEKDQSFSLQNHVHSQIIFDEMTL